MLRGILRVETVSGCGHNRPHMPDPGCWHSGAGFAKVELLGWSLTRAHIMAGEVPRHCIITGGAHLAELSIFVDESGDFGELSEYYVVAMVFHEQSRSISAEVDRLAVSLREAGLDESHAIHTGPAIRGSDEYRDVPVSDRLREFTRLFAFVRRAPISYQTFVFRKRVYADRFKLKGAISKALSIFLRDNALYLLSFDRVIIYYDNGQAEITDILNTLFNAFLFDVDFRRVLPAKYRLFQVADLCCTLELLRRKDEDGRLTRSDLYFFESRSNLRKSYLKQLDKKKFTQ